MRQVKRNDLLLVVDVQNDFFPGGALAVPKGDAILRPVNELGFRFQHCVQTQDWHPAGHTSFASRHAGKEPFETIELPYGEQILWPDHCVQGTHGAEFHPGLDIPGVETIVRKGYDPEIDSYSAFFENDHETPTGLDGYLRERGLGRIYAVGLAADFCVLYSVLDARRQGYEVAVVEDGVRGIDVDGSLGAAWRKMEEAGVVRLRSTDLRFESG
ncbi:MAG: bifunctional nicotinamidase/pyrazinamidase [Candidatus Eisenbacteria bacterium]|nr:bifunctional nicotinamidase/pyrazinamidase [Candidatus Latescibacterota bacterium]MBD3300935.1 bifunctional nicotinamidase/pyrazinamidase [Candidatus Eisenbacteria bacterium]